jgi:hypothetical protein
MAARFPGRTSSGNCLFKNSVLQKYIRYYWIWDNEEQRKKNRGAARTNIAQDVEKYLKDNFAVIVIGIRFLTVENIGDFMGLIAVKCPVHLYHLSVPFALREQRLNQRGAHALIDLPRDQKDRDAIKEWLGYRFENINSPEIDAENLMALIRNDKGLIVL